MIINLNASKNRLQIDKQICFPVLFRLSNPSDKQAFELLLAKTPPFFIHDEIEGQLKELLKSRNTTSKLSADQMAEAISKHVGDVPIEEYGCWVYYPWSSRLVHILDEKEFIEVRTNRNQYKITPGEREILAEKKIGIMGLSVGQSIAVTLAMERGCGELRLADFDDLELSNLNRIRYGVHGLDIPKVVMAAREIAEIDPFLKLVCYGEGITEANIDDFFMKDGAIDILVEECDGLDMKILARLKAKGYKIPVVMDTSDRGMIDVERFDLEPDRSILHGLIDHLDFDLKKIKNLTNEEKIPFILPIVGAESISTRLKASMMEVEQSISTWPQLASSVILGGALGADVCRRILLDQFHQSGRYYVDSEEIISDLSTNNEPYLKKEFQQEDHLHAPSELSEAQMIKYILLCPSEKGGLQLTAEQINEMVTAACLAPTGGNCQPWKWLYYQKTLYLFHDMVRSRSFLDFQHTGSYLGFGAATENLILKAQSLNLEVELSSFPLPDHPELIASYKFHEKGNIPAGIQVEKQIPQEWLNMVYSRHTNRKNAKRIPIPQNLSDELKKTVASIDGAELKLLETPEELNRIAKIISSMDRLRILHEEGHKEMMSEIRWTKEENEKKRDGVDIATLEVTPSEVAAFMMARNWSAIKYLVDWAGGKAFEKMSKKSIDAASSVGLVVLPEYKPENYFAGGRAVERLWLKAAKEGIAFQPMTAGTFIYMRMLHGNAEGIPERMKKEMNELLTEFISLFHLEKNSAQIMLFRLSYADEPQVKSIRRYNQDILTIYDR